MIGAYEKLFDTPPKPNKKAPLETNDHPEMDDSDFWYASADDKAHPIKESFIDDLPAPEWFAFGDKQTSRMIYLLHHQDDSYPDNYVSRPYMTVLGFGRSDKNKYLNTTETFSIGFVESSDYQDVEQAVKKIIQ